MTDRPLVIKNASNSLNRLLNWYLNDSDIVADDQGWFVSELVPSHLRDVAPVFREVDATLPNQLELHFESIVHTAWYSNDTWFADTVDALSRILSQDSGPELLGPSILHGSMAIGDYSLGWSDFDIFAIVPTSTLRDPERLLALRDKALNFREILEGRVPFQHHGVQFVVEDSLNWYDEGLLPVAAIRRGKSLATFGEHFSVRPVFHQRSSLNLLQSRINLLKEAKVLGELRHHAYKGVFLQNSFRNASNGLYQLKYLLDVCTLAPAIAMAAAGVPTDKGSAISRLKQKLPKEDWAIIDSATNVRAERSFREGLNYSGNRIPTWIQQIVGVNYFEQALNLHVACFDYASRIGTE